MQSFPSLHNRVHPAAKRDEAPNFLLQSGVTRTNCVDCLDRTNVVQFGLGALPSPSRSSSPGKVALGYQLHALGLVSSPSLSLQSELCRVYEELFDEQGDTIAWQYAGSQLVHSIKTYKKTAVFQAFIAIVIDKRWRRGV